MVWPIGDLYKEKCVYRDKTYVSTDFILNLAVVVLKILLCRSVVWLPCNLCIMSSFPMIIQVWVFCSVLPKMWVSEAYKWALTLGFNYTQKYSLLLIRTRYFYSNNDARSMWRNWGGVRWKLIFWILKKHKIVLKAP